MISEVDHYVGRLLDQLETMGIADNTMVMFTSDHGEYMGDHLRYAKGYPGEDCISRVPFIVKWPRGIENPGRTFEGIVEAVDMVPTVLDSAGIPIPQHVQGTSLGTILNNRENSGKPFTLMESKGWRNLRTDRYRYLCESKGNEALYDLESDPLQYVDLVDKPDYQGVLAEMRKLMLQKMIEINEPLPRTWTY